MTDFPDFNFPAFYKLAKELRTKGHKVVNPAEIVKRLGPVGSLSHEEYLRADIKALLTCDAICLMKGWLDSKGACFEHYVATETGIRVFWQGDPPEEAK